MKIIFSPTARRDLQRLQRFLLEVNPTTIKKAAEKLRGAFLLLIKHPLAGYVLDHLPPFREWLVPFGRGNDVIRYRTHKNEIHIVHLWHSREERFD